MIVTTPSTAMTPEVYDRLLKLYKEYTSTIDPCSGSEPLSCSEFIERKLQTKDTSDLSDDVIASFALLVNHRKFLQAIKTDFVRHSTIRNYGDLKITMVLFLAVFSLREDNTEDVFETIKHTKCAFKTKVLEYLLGEANLIRVALIGCGIFEDDYVLKNVIHPLLNHAEVIEWFLRRFREEEEKRRERRRPTVPCHLGVLSRKGPAPTVPLNTPVTHPRFRRKGVPKSTYFPSMELENRLMSDYEKNKRRAMDLLVQAKTLSKKYEMKKKVSEGDEQKVKQKRMKPAEPYRRATEAAEVKTNVASVLREATQAIKEQKAEISNIESLMQGANTTEVFKELEKGAKEAERVKFIEDIERKHLEGQLTFEEAILARKVLQFYNRQKFKLFQQEREEYLDQIEAWKEEEERRIYTNVLKAKDIEEGAKESCKFLKDAKRSQAAKLKAETKELLDLACKRHQEDIERKARLIKEIKELHQLKMLKNQEKSKSPSLHALCGMSADDLLQRLGEMKAKMLRQLEQKRRCITEYKETRRQMVENAKNYVAQTRMSKPKGTVPNRTTAGTDLARNPDLLRLRDRLEETRELRKIAQEMFW